MRKTAFWFIMLLAGLCLSLGTALAQPLPHPEVKILVNRDAVNVRILPEIGADVIGFVNAGWTAQATGRSPDNQWVRIDFNGQEGWIGLPVINVFGDLNVLPVADPRTIPYGGFDSPRSGVSTADSAIKGKLALSGLRLRAGPSTAYPVLANMNRYSVFPLTGRTINNAWLQVNFQGTLGWVDIKWVEIQNGASILDLPVDGLVASAPPVSQSTKENYIGTLRFMLDRINLAQPSLDSIRGTWTTVALGQRAACQNFPARPSDINIANPLLAAFFPILDPLQKDFNTAMFNVRKAVDLWIEACGQPQPADGVIGRATVEGALNTIQLADGQFADLRRRINELLPPLVEVGGDECLFSFQDQFDVLKIITLGKVVQNSFDPKKGSATGFCIDVSAGAALRIEVLKVKGEFEPLVSISPFDNPTQFLSVGRGITGQNLLTVGPVMISKSGRYLVVLSDAGTQPATVNYALLVTNVAGLTQVGPGLIVDPVTGNVVVNAVSTPIPGATTVPGAATATPGAIACPSLAFNCSQLISCAEAQACLKAGNFSLDAAPQDNQPGNGVACQAAPLNCQ